MVLSTKSSGHRSLPNILFGCYNTIIDSLGCARQTFIKIFLIDIQFLLLTDKLCLPKETYRTFKKDPQASLMYALLGLRKVQIL